MIAKQHLLTQFKVKTNKTFSYLCGAAWDKAKEITNKQEWYKYLEMQKNKLNTTVYVKIN